MTAGAGPGDTHAPPSAAPRIGAVVLAAGSSSRLGPGRNKLLEVVAGRRVVDHVIECARASCADPVLLVVRPGDGLAVDVPGGVGVVENPRAAEGLSTSLIAGLRSLPEDVEGAFVLLADMPLVTPADLDALAAAFRSDVPCVPMVEGRRGNPVLWPRTFFERIFCLRGDRGAVELIERESDRVVRVHLDNRGLLVDIDTPGDLDHVSALAG